MVSFTKTINDIKTLKIQGAESIAKSTLIALRQKATTSKAITKGRFLRELHSAKELLFTARPTEPCMRNCLYFVLMNCKGASLQDLKSSFFSLVEAAIDHLNTTEKKIAEIGANKIKDNMIVFTHCHSSTVIGVLKKAAQQNKKFFVNNTETRPMFQGRITATELAKVGIPITHYVDAAARYALKKADLMLIGADAISSEGKIINKIGSELFAEVANKFEVPVYVCTDSWKFDAATIFGYEDEIETRKASEIWKKPPHGVIVDNHAFEKIDPNLVTGIISELGIYKPEIFVEELKRNYKWMFR